MRVSSKIKSKRSANSRFIAASAGVLERMEKRVMMSISPTLAPVNVGVAVGGSATFTASAAENQSKTTTLSYQWQYSSDGGNTYNNVTSSLPVTGITGFSGGPSSANTSSTTLTVPATQADAGDYFRAQFTSSNTSTPVYSSVAAQLGVIGGAVTQWIFNSTTPETIETSLSDTTLVGTPGQPSPTPNAVGTGDAPLPTFSANPYNTSTGNGDIAQTFGLFNDYSGGPVYSGADILHAQSTIQPTFDPYGWRIRSNHTVTGWSQLAPAAVPGLAANQTTTDANGEVVSPQGVEFRVNTTGYNNLTFHFDWDGGGIADMQPQYSPDGGVTWFNAGGILQNFASDYPGITATTNPPGYTVALEGGAFPAAGQANSPFNNPNFELRLAAAYDPNLPLISDGNADAYQNLTVTSTPHGQYATSSAGAQAEVQLIDIGGTPDHLATSPYQQQAVNVTGGTYQLSYGSAMTALIPYNAAPATVQADLNAIAAINNAGGVTVAPFQLTPNDVANEYNNFFLGVTFNSTTTAEVPLTIAANNLTGPNSNAQATLTVPVVVPYAAAASVDPTTGYEQGVTRFVDSNAATGANGGDWTLADFSLAGFSVTNGPTIITQPASTSVIGGNTATFTATDYSPVGGVTAQWQVNNGSGWANVTTGTASNSGNTFTYSFTTTGAPSYAQNGYQYRVILTDSNSNSTTSFAATLTSQGAVSPSVTTQPTSISVQAGITFSLTAAATGFPTPTVQWQQSIGSVWTNLPADNGITQVGSTTDTLSITTATTATGTLQYRAVFTNSATPSTAISNTATVSLLGNETVFTQWNFGTTKTQATAITAGYSTNQVTGVTTLQANTGTGVLTALGFSIPNDYANQADGASGTGVAANTYTALDPVYNQTFTYGTGNFSDVTNTAGAQNPALTENLWRPRGGVYNGAAGAPGNGFSNYAKQYTQGAEFATSTAGYTNIYVTMDVYTTTSGELDARQQYTTDGVNWYNLYDHQLAWNASATQTVTYNASLGTYVDSNPDDSLDPNDIPTSFVNGIPQFPAGYVPPLDLNSNDFYGATAIYDNHAITSASVTNNVVTISASNDYVVGQKVNIAGVANSSNTKDTTLSALNGIFTITSETPTSFTYTVTGVGSVGARTQGTSAYASLGGYAIPMVFNLTGIAGVANNPKFAVRLVNAYDPSLPNTTSVLFGDQTGSGQNLQYIASSHGQYAVASSAGGPTVYPGSAGNWRFGNITFHGDLITPTWYSPGNSTYVWSAETETLTITGGTTGTIIADPAGTGDSPNILVSGSGTNVIFNSSTPDVHIGGLSLTGGATAVMASNATPQTLIVAPVTSNFTVSTGSTFDLGSNMIDFQGSSSAQQATIQSSVLSLLTAGYDSGWTGGGIFSSKIASAPQLMSIGWLSNTAGFYGTAGTLGTFNGADPSTNDVLVRYTYYGDANLDGKVDGTDYSDIDAAYAAHAAAIWADGNFNYDGTIDGSDYTLIDNAFNTQGGPIAGAAAQIAGSSFASGTPIRYALPADLISTQSSDQTKKKSVAWASTLIDSIVTT